jgi:RecT family
MVAVYAIVRLKDADPQWEVMTKAKIDEHRRKYSRASGDDTPWITAYEEMARKTVLKRVLKLAPVSVELQRVIAHEEHIEAELPPTVELLPEPVAPEPSPSKLEALTARLPEAAPTVPPAEEDTPPAPLPAAQEHDPERQALLSQIVAGVSAWGKPPSPALWIAICQEVAGVTQGDIEQADPAVLADLLAFVQAVHRGERAAMLRLSTISRSLVKAAPKAPVQPDLS